MPPLIYGIWAAVKDGWSPNVALGTFAAFVLGVVLVVAVKFNVLMTPKVETLRAAEQAARDKRQGLIDSWREMVRQAHSELQTYALQGLPTTVTEVLELKAEFLTFRP